MHSPLPNRISSMAEWIIKMQLWCNCCKDSDENDDDTLPFLSKSDEFKSEKEKGIKNKINLYICLEALLNPQSNHPLTGLDNGIQNHTTTNTHNSKLKGSYLYKLVLHQASLSSKRSLVLYCNELNKVELNSRLIWNACMLASSKMQDHKHSAKCNYRIKAEVEIKEWRREKFCNPLRHVSFHHISSLLSYLQTGSAFDNETMMTNLQDKIPVKINKYA